MINTRIYVKVKDCYYYSKKDEADAKQNKQETAGLVNQAGRALKWN